MEARRADLSLDRTLAEAAGGDQEAWSRIVARYGPRLYAIVVRQCGDRELAEEITQATFVQLVVSIDGYREQGRFEAWLFRIAMNRLRDEMRRRKRQAKPLGTMHSDAALNLGLAAHRDTADDPHVQASRAEQVALLKSAVARLTPRDREILLLRHTAGLSFPQIAETLREPLGTVLARAHRAVGKLRQTMGAHPSTVRRRRLGAAS